MSINPWKDKKDFRSRGGIKAIKYIGKRVFKSNFRGYPGLTHTARRIAEYIPKCEIYVEPFAGLGRVAKHIKAETKVLNDKSEYAVNYLRKNFPNALIQNRDFERVIYDYKGPNTTFLIDPPWFNEVYNENELSYCDRKPNEYYDKIFELVHDSKSHWFVCCQWKKNLDKYGDFYSIIIHGPTHQKRFGGVPKTKVYSNKPFIRYHQRGLTK